MCSVHSFAQHTQQECKSGVYRVSIYEGEQSKGGNRIVQSAVGTPTVAMVQAVDVQSKR